MRSVRAADMNALIEWIQRRNMGRFPHDGTVVEYSGPDGTWGSVPRDMEEEWIGQIVEFGPDDEGLEPEERSEPYTDARYWVKKGRAATRSQRDPNPRGLVRPAVYESGDTRSRWITATNLNEILGGTHTLDMGTWVKVTRTFDLSSPRQRRYYFSSGGGGIAIRRARVQVRPTRRIIEVRILDWPTVGEEQDQLIRTTRFPPEARLDRCIPFLQAENIIQVARLPAVLDDPELDALVEFDETFEDEKPRILKSGLAWYCIFPFMQIGICEPGEEVPEELGGAPRRREGEVPEEERSPERSPGARRLRRQREEGEEPSPERSPEPFEDDFFEREPTGRPRPRRVRPGSPEISRTGLPGERESPESLDPDEQDPPTDGGGIGRRGPVP